MSEGSNLSASCNNDEFDQHISAFKNLLGAGGVMMESHDVERHKSDWSLDNPCVPSLVLKPDSSELVSKVLTYCNKQILHLVVQGGLTGLSGGATPKSGEIVLSLDRLKGITELDQQSMTITALAGTPLEYIQQAAAEVDLRLPLDLGARGSCQIGGNVSTNAGGNQVIQFGMTRALVLGLEAVLPDGTIMRSMNKMLKNNAGYDLKQLFIGSEGTLGVVTEVSLRLYPEAGDKHTVFCAFDSVQKVFDFLSFAQRKFSRLSAFEVLWHDYYQGVLEFCEQIADPFDQAYAAYVLIEVESDANYGVDSTERDKFEAVLVSALEQSMVSSVLIAQSKKEANTFWAIREGIGEMLSRIPLLVNFDIGVPVSSMMAFVEDVESLLHSQFKGLQLNIFGHIADGNLHIIGWTENSVEDVPIIYERVYELIDRYDGTVTAEHGVGVMKKNHLHQCRSEAEINVMKRLKLAFDPNNILNSGRIFDLESDE